MENNGYVHRVKTSIKYDPKEYMKWDKKYKRNPIKTRNELRSIKEYYKQYLYILSLTRNKKLTDEIYKIIIDKLRQDIYNSNHGKKISTLAKWLPRENKSFDIQLGFVKEITDRMYPGMAKNEAYKLYRQINSKLCEKIGVAEQKLVKNNFDEIDFKTMPIICMRKNMIKMIKDDKTKTRLFNFLGDKFSNISDKNYIELLLSNDMHPIERRICIAQFSVRKLNILDKNRYLNYITSNNLIPIIDMSNSLFKSNDIYTNLMICLVAMEYSDKIIINAKNPIILEIYHKKGIDYKINEIMKYLVEHTVIDLNLIKKHANEKCNKLLIISDKNTIGSYSSDIYYYPKRVKVEKSTWNRKLFLILKIIAIIFVIFSMCRIIF